MKDAKVGGLWMEKWRKDSFSAGVGEGGGRGEAHGTGAAALHPEETWMGC